jgi:ankyrin repeat protein
VVKVLLEDERVDPATGNNFAIKMASEYGHLEVVKLLLEDRRADPAAESNDAVGSASREGHLEVVKLLLKEIQIRRFLRDQKIL